MRHYTEKHPEAEMPEHVKNGFNPDGLTAAELDMVDSQNMNLAGMEGKDQDWEVSIV